MICMASEWWFEHDANARDDQKIKVAAFIMRDRLGVTRAQAETQVYADYFRLLELLWTDHDPSFMLDLSTVETAMYVADQISEDNVDVFMKRVQIYVEAGLFEREFWDDENHLWSKGLAKRKEKAVEISRKRSEAAYKSHEVRRRKKEEKENASLEGLKDAHA